MWKTISVRGQSDVRRAREALRAPLRFGTALCDLMFEAHHAEGRGWHEAAIVPQGPIALSPAAKVLHYGLEIFEGHKAYRWPDGRVALFRPSENARRLNESARRVGLPEVPEALQAEATRSLVHLLRAWIPDGPGSSLYLRPTLIGTEPALGVGPSRSHLYFIIACPVGAYFDAGLIGVRVEDEYVRAAPGGLGAAKTGGNYAAGILAQARAHAEGFQQVLFLDAREHRFVEELAGMNAFAVIDGRLVTPPLGGTILAGITRRSLLELAPTLGLEAEERPIAIDALVSGIEQGRVSELFAVGTAAVVTSIGRLGYRGRELLVGGGRPGLVALRLREAVLAIQHGLAPDPFGWMEVVTEPLLAADGTAGSEDQRTARRTYESPSYRLPPGLDRP